MKKPQALIDAAIARLQAEDLFPVAELADRPFPFPDGYTVEAPTAMKIVRWGTAGIRGVYLDVLYCARRACWVTSHEAVTRFTAAVAERRRGSQPIAE